MPDRILMISRHFPPDPGGAQVIAGKISAYAENNNIDLHIITFRPFFQSDAQPSLEIKGSVSIRRLKGLSIFAGVLERSGAGILAYIAAFLFSLQLFLSSFYYVLRHRRELRSIYGFGGIISGAIAMVLAKLFSKRSAAHYELAFVFPALYRPIIPLVRWINNSLDLIISYTRGTALSLQEIGVKADHIRIIRNPVDTEHFRPLDSSKARIELGLPPDAFIVMYIGRFSVTKGVKMVAEAAGSCPDVHFVFVGGTSNYEKEILELGANADNVTVFPSQDNDRLPVFYNAGDIFAWGSAERDSFSITNYESWSCGVPVLMPTVNHLTYDKPMPIDDHMLEVLRDRMALLFEFSLENYISTIRRAAGDRSLLESMSPHCRGWVIENCSEQNLEKIFTLLMEGT